MPIPGVPIGSIPIPMSIPGIPIPGIIAPEIGEAATRANATPNKNVFIENPEPRSDPVDEGMDSVVVELM